ncbi:uncharacterized protein [Bombus fervidus]|uniref:uncharacterized protein n=1 Tax=Bombus fervidus TaxID=203811 RepID=UPI003AB13ACA
MRSNNFGKLRVQARQIDDGIEKLNTTWKLPHVLIGRFAECTAESDFYTEAMWNVIKSTQNGIEQTLSEMKEDSIHMEEFLQETKAQYESLKEQCDNLETVFEEYGYRYNENNVLEESNANSTRSPDQNSVEETENLKVEFTPNLSWKCKVKENGLLSACKDNYKSHMLMTALTNTSTSVFDHSS